MTSKQKTNRILKVAGAISTIFGLIIVIWKVVIPIYEASQLINKIPEIEQTIVEIHEHHAEAEEMTLEIKVVFDRVEVLERELKQNKETTQADSMFLDYVAEELLWLREDVDYLLE